MLTQSDVNSIATDLLRKYGSRSGILRHTDELIAEYGKEDYIRISYAAKDIRDSTGLCKRFPYDSPEKKEMRKKTQQLKSHFEAGKRYAFTAMGKRNGMDWEILVDNYGGYHPVQSNVIYSSGDRISCKVNGVYSKVQKNGQVIVNLRLSEPRRLRPLNEPPNPEEPIQYVKSPDKWYREVIDLGKHKCGKPFTCSCCGKDFAANQGVRVDFKEIYFCNACKKLIYEPSGRGWAGRIISTPMGNKR